MSAQNYIRLIFRKSEGNGVVGHFEHKTLTVPVGEDIMTLLEDGYHIVGEEIEEVDYIYEPSDE